MLDGKVDIQLDSGVTNEVKNGDMRDELIARLRSHARQSGGTRQARDDHRHVVSASERATPIIRDGTEKPEISIVEGEPQAVLIKNRSEDLEKSVTRLRNRYAKLLS